MKSLIISAAAVFLLATPSLAAPARHTTTHRTVHTTVHHGNNHTTHTTRHVTTHRTARTTHTRANQHRTVRTTHRRTTQHRTGNWHGRTTHRASNAVHVRVNIGGLRANINASHRYHYGTYHRPAGWYARRWTYGEHLPRAWYGANYRISNYITFGLVAPPDGYEWVRVGSDAILIDVDTGEVVRVVYGVFY
jgi:Ni/Co efflux regulator RcnB